MFRQDFTCPALLDVCRNFNAVRGYHPLWPDLSMTVPALCQLTALAWSAFARHY